MPSVAQVSSPRALTLAIMSAIFSRSRPLGLRQAAPMQKRVAPAALAAWAACSTSFSGSSLLAFTSVSKLCDWGQ